jgi:hypothetical protein
MLGRNKISHSPQKDLKNITAGNLPTILHIGAIWLEPSRIRPGVSGRTDLAYNPPSRQAAQFPDRRQFARRTSAAGEPGGSQTIYEWCGNSLHRNRYSCTWDPCCTELHHHTARLKIAGYLEVHLIPVDSSGIADGLDFRHSRAIERHRNW